MSVRRTGPVRYPGYVRMGVPAEDRRTAFVKLCWMFLWLVYLAYPVSDLLSGGHSLPALVTGWIALGAFLGCYTFLLLRRQLTANSGQWNPIHGAALGLMLAIALVTCATLDENWLALFTYTAVCSGAVLPPRLALPGVSLVAGLAVGTGLLRHSGSGVLISVAVSAYLGGAAMTGLQSLVRTMQELREAREAVAALAASDERLRMARDLHDLLGHSLSLITLKSELTNRFLDQERYAEARAQVADIEKVSRQSLVDVREAIGGFRRPQLAVEVAAARTALSAADVEVHTDPALGEKYPGLGPDEEGALGWALREAVTNVVRHSGASRCTVSLAEYPEHDGSRSLCLEVADDGAGAKRAARGHGLTGLAERLELAEGRLETGPADHGRGFRVRASVPLRAPTTPAPNDVGPPEAVTGTALS